MTAAAPIDPIESATGQSTPTRRCWRCLQTFACMSSIGPGATNLVTAAAVAHVNRLPVREIVSATHYVTDLTLGLGEVVFDYLAK